MAMFESLFFGGDKELVVDQAIMNAMGGQTVNQFARIRPDNPSSRQEINKLTIHMQDKRQPVREHAYTPRTSLTFSKARCGPRARRLAHCNLLVEERK